MNKSKIQIKQKTFSWENKNNKYTCDFKGCSLEGLYKAPKSKNNLKNYYFFCLKHIKEYNKSWDYYKGMTVNEIELSMRKDIVWDRPSWPTNGNHKIMMERVNDIFFSNLNSFIRNEDATLNIDDRALKDGLNKIERKSINNLGINLPITHEKIKKAYKRLVKKYHPDINKDDINAEKKFKEVNESYKILLKRFIKK